MSGQVRLVGKTIDLKSAYRQLSISARSFDVSKLAVFDPVSEGCKLFQQSTLPFGATASVWHFNRCSLSIQRLAACMGRVCVSNYFDDYPLIEFSATARSAEVFFKGICQLIGWKVALEPKKDLELAERFGALGVEVDFRRVGSGVIEVANKEARVNDIVSMVDSALAE
eukprot:1853075-Amphidinium_carterae.1